MQSEIFIMLMVVLVMLFSITLTLFQQRDRELLKANTHIVELKELLRKRNRPILQFSADHTFESGKAALTEQFVLGFEGKINEIEAIAARCDCDVIEIIGHTDGAIFTRDLRTSTLDRDLLDSLEDGTPERVTPTSNVELGMLRAASIVDLLRKGKQSGRLSHIEFIRFYSAGQAIMPDGTVASAKDLTEDPTRRRIELRISRSTGEDEPVDLSGIENIKPVERR